ncbi:pyridoxamine 5'-phosphate oxidase family protein [Streptomyces sp. NPDC093225]|uniref:pyridoxamine 5'-phosphate oxidase family protein n=1 Tax=Streptomyces sp. NPDC093225 TaxID=3366034 RepID=UPI003822ACE2
MTSKAAAAAAAGDLRRPAGRLTSEEAWSLLAGTGVGRLVFSRQALPAVRLVAHVVTQDGALVIRVRDEAVLGRGGVEAVVAYEADHVSSRARAGWSVVVTGVAAREDDADRAARYRGLLPLWDDGGGEDAILRITPSMITGRRLGPDGPRERSAPGCRRAGAERERPSPGVRSAG